MTTDTNTAAPAALTIADAANRLGVRQAQVRRLIRSGRLAAVQLGDARPLSATKNTRITPEALAAFLAGREVQL